MKRNLLPLVIAMLFVTGTAFAQETPQPADGVVEAPVSPEAAVGSSDCCNPCCDPCDPCCNQRQGFFARMRARRCCETTCCNECTTTVQTACCDPCDPCCNQRKGLFARMRDRRCCETTAVMIARLPLKRPAAILVIPAATNVWVSLLACELAVVVNQLATHAKRLQWPCLK